MQTKSNKSINQLIESNRLPIIQLYFEFNQLKQLYRQGWLKRGIPPAQCESVAEHSYGVALLALFLAEKYFPKLDLSKTVRMALIHDFGEIYTGDFTPDDNISPKIKYDLELQSIRKVFSKLAGGSEYISLWQEFELGKSPEAQFVRQIDRLEMGLQASVYAGQGKLDPSEFFKSAEKALVLPELKKIFNSVKQL